MVTSIGTETSSRRSTIRSFRDVRVAWLERAQSLSMGRARDGCGDTWAHALEGFLSPLGSPGLRSEIAELMDEMLSVPLGSDVHWFELSARACAAQARAGVGLVHGIAHVLERRLVDVASDRPFGHARLCSVFLQPVLALNRAYSPKFDELMGEHAVDSEAVLAVAADLFDPVAYDRALPILEAHWRDILRDPCTRTNCTLVRPAHLAFFAERRFL